MSSKTGNFFFARSFFIVLKARMVLNTDGCECNKLTQSSRKSSIKGEVLTKEKFIKNFTMLIWLRLSISKDFFWSSRHHFFIMLWKRKFFPRAVGMRRHCLYISHDIQDTVECHQIPQNVINLVMIFELSASSWRRNCFEKIFKN